MIQPGEKYIVRRGNLRGGTFIPFGSLDDMAKELGVPRPVRFQHLARINTVAANSRYEFNYTNEDGPFYIGKVNNMTWIFAEKDLEPMEDD